MALRRRLSTGTRRTAAIASLLLGLAQSSCQPSSSLTRSEPATQSGAQSSAGTPEAQRRPGPPKTSPPKRLLTSQAPGDLPPEAPPAPAESSPATAVRRPFRVAFMGDSLTDASSHGGGFIQYLAERCPESQFDNFGKGGDMINQMRRRFQEQVLASEKYSHVVVFGGVNDLYSDLTANRNNEQIQQDLAQMYTWSREMGALVVAINVAPWGGFRRYFNPRRGENTLKLNRWIAEQEGQLTEATIDAHTLLRCGQPHRLCPDYAGPFKDGIHFGSAGHERIGKALFDAVFSRCR